jgi:hypothetical protein
MSTGSIVIIVIVVVVILAVVALVLRPQMQRRRLRDKFGPEYDRTVSDADGRRAAERELAQREQRHAKFDLRPLSADERARYTREWADVQERFVDAPAEAVASADSLVTGLMGERGYPTEGYEQQLSDLSVEHSATLEHYRAAHDINVRQGSGVVGTEAVDTATTGTETETDGTAVAGTTADGTTATGTTVNGTSDGTGGVSTEDLRNAMVHYRALFQDLLRGGGTDEPDLDETTTGERGVDEPGIDDRAVDERGIDEPGADEVPVETSDVDARTDTDVDGDVEARPGRVGRA